MGGKDKQTPEPASGEALMKDVIRLMSIKTDECPGFTTYTTPSKKEIDSMVYYIASLLERERERCIAIVKSKKLPVPNPYGTTVKVTRYNQVMDEIISQLSKK